MENKKILYKDNLLSNIAKFQDKQLCAMVKSNAYGHGLEDIVKLANEKVEMFGVVNTEEALAVRKLTDKRILICSKNYDAKVCKKNNFEVIVDDENDLQTCVRYGLQDSCHLKINCGMNRFGTKSNLCVYLLNDFLEKYNVKLRSISTHFHTPENRRQTMQDYERFLQLRAEITQNAPICFGGSKLIDYPFDFDILRLGIGMYGYGREGLMPVMEISSFVEKIFYAYVGEFIGYGKKFRVKKAGYFAVVPVGYGDGLKRNLSEKFKVAINGKKYMSVGSICMDAFFVEIDESVKVGDKVVVMSNAESFAKKLGTISYEVLTGFSNLRGKTEIL